MRLYKCYHILLSANIYYSNYFNVIFIGFSLSLSVYDKDYDSTLVWALSSINTQTSYQVLKKKYEEFKVHDWLSLSLSLLTKPITNKFRIMNNDYVSIDIHNDKHFTLTPHPFNLNPIEGSYFVSKGMSQQS